MSATHMRWEIHEIKRLLTEIHWEEWQRGDVGQCLYMLLLENAEIREKIGDVAVAAIHEGNEEAAWAALYLSVYWAGRHGLQRYNALVMAAHEFRHLPLAREIEYILARQDFVTLFE
jgi:hypothetical protein